jgi:hypothetical protein
VMGVILKCYPWDLMRGWPLQDPGKLRVEDYLLLDGDGFERREGVRLIVRHRCDSIIAR